MSEPTPENNPAHALGAGVWVKVVNRIWWPGIVVDPITVPEDLFEYVQEVKPVAVVKFEQENKYQVVRSSDPIFLYTCDRKMEFVEKGYSLYKNQKKGLPVIGQYDMDNFKKDVVLLERLTGGNTSIFQNIDQKQEEVKAAKQGFTPTNTKKSKKKEASRKSLSVPKTPKTAPKTTPQTTPKSTPKTQPILVSVPKTAAQPRAAPRPRISPQSKVVKTFLQTPSTAYSCHSRVGCNFTTNRYTNLKRHMALHKDDTDITEDTDVVSVKKPSTRSTSNKRKNLRTRSSEIKKQKLQEELLKDWENDGEDEEVDLSKEQSTSKDQMSSDVVQLPSNVVHSTEEVVPTNEVQSSINVVQLSNEEVVQTTSNVLSSKNDVVPTISNDIPTGEVQETITSSNKVFDFNENDNNIPVVELRQSKSDCSPTVDGDILDTFESRVTSDFINNTIFEASPKETPLVEKTTEDSFNKPHDIHSNEFDDQTRSTELLLDTTVNVLDQINNFKNSLSGISSSINEPDANILTGDNNVVIDVSESCGDEYLEKPTSLNKAIHTETNGIGIPLVENVSIETEDYAIVGENTNDKEIVSNDVEVNQSNGTTIDKDMHIENSCSIDSISNKINCEEKISKKKVNLPNTQWTDKDWKSFPESGLAEASYSAEIELPTSHKCTLPKFLK
ncbi:uncharacterized protein LOC111043188 isoform X2 [Myzus persicae]|uniref:uncharacterized protein LOC111043188 isoform X2 n=1 Tax=Myzus persicae TaxID=13164 RepID=UPI000B935BB8|nr:uncharacterized protein LOC111043188 isoform X2 [Myzus persicae]